MTHLERLAMTTVMLALAGSPALAQPGAHWVGGETGMAVDNTPGSADRAQVQADLAAARKARGLTQPDLSALTGIQQAEISRFERGVGNPTAATLLRLADALGQRLTLTPV